MSLLTYLDPNAIKDASIEGIKIKNGAISSSKIDETVASKNYVDNKTIALEAKVTNAVQITYSKLKALRDNGKLVPGTQYRITDYTCTTTQEGTKSAGHVFDIIVTADYESTLNEEARAALHSGDEYFSGCSLNAWKIWYCLDNDTNRFEWAMYNEALIDTIKPITGSASGTYTYSSPISKIVFHGKAYNLEIGVRTTLYGAPPTYITKTDDYTLVVEDEYNYVIYSEISVYTEGKGVIYRMIDEFGNDVPYDFKNIQFKHPNDTTTYLYYYYTFASDNVEDNTDNSISIANHCYSNTIREYISNSKQRLNCIIFIGYDFQGYGTICNTFGANCYNNTFGKHCFGNYFGDRCHDNTFGENCSANYFSADCYGNTFGANCHDNTFGKHCVDNTFENCIINTFGNDCQLIKFASDSSASTGQVYYQHNHFGNGCKYILFKGTKTTSYPNQVQNYNFAQGLQGTRNAYLTIDGVRNLSYETKVAKNSNGEVKIYCEADLIL